MQRDRVTSSLRPHGLRALAGRCLLWLYLGAATPVVPMGVALLAECDRSHHVALRQAARGLQVVLRHDCVNSPAHRHGIVARTLTVFAQPPTTPDSDHVIQFSAPDTTSQAPTLAVQPSAQTPAPDACLPCDVRICASHPATLLAALPRPPPAPSELLLTVRSTVLLV